MATSKVSAEERTLRKRHAARVRQQRCRARKREALMERQLTDKVHVPTVNVCPSENHHPNHRVPPRFPRQPSPRNVYWKEAPHWGSRFPAMNSDQRISWVYDSPHTETRYDSGPAKPVYSKYSPALPPRVLMPQFAPIQQPQPRYYAPQQFIAEREPEYYPRRVEQEYRPELEYRQQAPQHQQLRALPWPVTSAQVHPRRLVPRLQPQQLIKQEPIKSKEEAAVDAILSLKAEIVSPPKIKRYALDHGSAFKAQQQHRAVRPGFYLSM